MIEIMEPSDWAVRIEFEKGGYVLPEEARFLGRDPDFALSMFDFNKISLDELREKYFAHPVNPKSYGEDGTEYEIINSKQTNCFRVNRLEVTGSLDREDDSFYVGIVTRGHGTLKSGRTEIELKQWDKFFVPYKTGSINYTADEDMEIVITRPPLSK